MPQTQPTFIIEFMQKAVTAIARSAQGVVALILDDKTLADDTAVYNNFGEVVKESVDAKTYELLDLTFRGKPRKVIVVKKQTLIADTIKILKKFKYNYVAMPSAASEDVTALTSYIDEQRRKLTGFMKLVVADATAPDNMAVINFADFENAKYSRDNKSVAITAGEYTCRIAGILAGMPDSRSATYYELPELVNMDIIDDPDAAAGAGKFVVLFDDGKYKLGRAINSLTTLTDGVTAAFQKIRVISTLDLIAEDIVTTFRNSYVGKYVNDYTNKVRFCGAVNSYLHQLEPLLLDENMTNEVKVSYEKNKAYLEKQGISTANLSVQEILQYNTGAYVGLDGTASPTDTMEDLDLSVNLYE